MNGPSRIAVILGAVILVCGLVVVGIAFFDGTEDAALAEPSSPSAAAVTPVLSARRIPSWTTASLARHEMAAALDPLMDRAPVDSCLQVGDGVNVLYSRNAEAQLIPGSNLKLLTAPAALDILGGDTTLDTLFLADSEIADGTINGNLYMVGGGDPLLTSDGYQSIQRKYTLPETDLEAIADRLVELGLTEVTGSVVGDATRYDADLYVDSWQNYYLADGEVGSLSALLANDGWLVDPTTGTGASGPTDDPAAHAASVLTQLLRERGVAVQGPPASGQAPEGSVAVHTTPSLPMSALADDVLVYSDNTTTELLVKEIGLKVSGEPTTEAGVRAIVEWAKTKGYPVEASVLVDGSGLSYDNRISCALLGSVLRDSGPSGTLSESLAVPGEPGTLVDRFTGEEWTGNLRAKTGSLNVVKSLSGWLASRTGTDLDFEMLFNPSERRAGVKDSELQQEILRTLLDHPIIPSLNEAGPIMEG